VTDRRTDTGRQQRPRLRIASCGKSRDRKKWRHRISTSSSPSGCRMRKRRKWHTLSDPVKEFRFWHHPKIFKHTNITNHEARHTKRTNIDNEYYRPNYIIILLMFDFVSRAGLKLWGALGRYSIPAGAVYTGVGKIGDFRRKSPFIPETVRDRPGNNTKHFFTLFGRQTIAMPIHFFYYL